MPIAFASVFTDHMVLQQGVPAPIWGTADAGSTVTVTFGDQQVSAVADDDGRWEAMLAPLAASADGAELRVSASPSGDAPALVCKDVLVGEVWLCSGQSNMGFTVATCDDAAKHIADAANHSAIRLLKAPRRRADEPQPEFQDASWAVCSSKTVAGFSGVGYFFGLELHRKLGVPVGLIDSSWGGTIVEAWTSRAGLLSDSEGRELVAAYDRELPRLPFAQADHQAKLDALGERTRDKENLGHPRGWAGEDEPTDAEWNDMRLPGTWQSNGLSFSGILWFRKVVDVPADWAGKDLQLDIGATDKSDVTYFNNEQVGSLTMADQPDAWSALRSYRVPGRLVKAGRNVIAVRVHSDMYAGGMTGPTDMMQLTLADADAATAIPLAGTWRYAVEANYGQIIPPPAPPGPDNPNSPTVLYNGMIHALLPMAIRGAIWYQGESNASRPIQYRTLFETLIRDWRTQWNNDNLAFYFVQLANFKQVREQPIESEWATLREAQAMALSLPHTGMAVAIDVGDADDIHPTNKLDVGLRLAYNALHQTYGQTDVTPCGPLAREAVIEGNAMRITFAHIADGLVSRDGPLKGFAIAGEDGQFVWANARIDGDCVIVSSPSVPKPKAVRYAWADNPACSLYNTAGLPASPFRTDGDGWPIMKAALAKCATTGAK